MLVKTDGTMQVSDRPENLVGPPALGYLASWI